MPPDQRQDFPNFIDDGLDFGSHFKALLVVTLAQPLSKAAAGGMEPAPLIEIAPDLSFRLQARRR
jgi:hypothetical protein